MVGRVPPVLLAFGAAMTWRPLGLRSVLLSTSIAVACGAVQKPLDRTCSHGFPR
jgi:hypothetical protein